MVEVHSARGPLHQPPPSSTNLHNLSIIRNDRHALRASPPVRSACRRAPSIRAVARGGRLHGPRGFGQAPVCDRDPAAQRHGGAAHGPGPEQRDPGRAHPLRAHAGARGAVASGHRPRRDRDAKRGGAPDRQGGKDPLRPGTGAVRGARVGVRARDRPHHPRAAQGDRRVLRLEPHPVHARPGLLARGAGGVRPPVGGGPDLSRPSRDPLVPALPHLPLRRGSGVPGGGREALLHPVPGRGRAQAIPHGGDDAPRDLAVRHGGRRESQRRALRRVRGQGGPAPHRRHPDPDPGRRCGGARVRDGGGESHPRPRRDGLRDRAASQARDAARDDRGRPHGAPDARPEVALGARPVRRPREDRGPAQGARPAREDPAVPACRASLLPLRLRGGASAQRSVVREDETAGGAGARGISLGGDPARTRALGRDVSELDGEHPRLEHLATAVVGPPHPRVHLRRVRLPVGGPRGCDDLPQVRRPGRAGPRRARHMVLILALAVRDARLAARDARPEALLPGPHARHGAGDPVFLGRPDDHGRVSLSRRPPVLHGVPARHRAGHAAPQDVEVARQRDRSTRCGAAVRRRCASLDDDRRGVARIGLDPGPGRSRHDVRPGAELREQALEHRALHLEPAA